MKQKIKGIISGLIPESIKKRIDQKKTEQIFRNGYTAFLHTGETPIDAYNALINLYCSTNGKFNEKEHLKLSESNPPKKISETIKSYLGTLDTKDFNEFNKTLTKDGYVNLNKVISLDLVKSIYDFALKTPALIAPKYDKPVLFDTENPLSEIYRFSIPDLMNNKDLQALIMDPALINIARNYLNCEPIFDFPAMWWSTTFLKEASSEAAQLYHFDMDRIKWLKIFIYLNDVSPENGPHRYIRGSHKAGSKPAELLKRGYTRIPDEDLKKYYPEKDFIELNAPAGSIFAGDTKCWHKGTLLKKGKRLVLEFEYTSSMFGTNYQKFNITNTSKAFKQFCEENKTYASNISFTD